ncbi:MAG: hypothetical protein QOG30_1820, partial [Acidimicrobiaceae bacterium]
GLSSMPIGAVRRQIEARRDTVTTRRRAPRRGDGSVWLIADRLTDKFDCYWYTGAHDDQLVDQSGAGTATEAVTWGRARTPRVRIRTRDGRSQWAGTAPRPDTFTTTWEG